MQTLSEEQLKQLTSVLAMPAFLAEGDQVRPLNQEGVDLHLPDAALLACLPQDGRRFSGRQICPTPPEAGWRYTLSGSQILLDGRACWLLEAAPFDLRDTLEGIHKIAAARQIMLEISSRIDHLETESDIYEFILDSCGKAVEHSELCTLMVVEGDNTRIVAKRGFTDDVYNIRFEVKNVFLALATEGRLDRIARINDLSLYHSKYNMEAKTQKEGELLSATLSAPIYVNHELYAILNFDSVRKNAFTREDEELLSLVKGNIEIILENHRMHAEILRLSQTDLLTGLYNRTYLRSFLWKNQHRTLCLGIFDMNNLKGINDGHGHPSGDIALKALAEGIQWLFPAEGTCFRMGGDEFLCVLPPMEQTKIDARIAALRRSYRESPLVLADGASAELSFSCGFAVHEAGTPWDHVLQTADDKMYREKRRMKGLAHETRQTGMK